MFRRVKQDLKKGEHWLTMLKSMPLSHGEKEAVEKYSRNTEGRGFLPIVDILKAHRKKEEALEFLREKVLAHPRFGAGRVALARDLLGVGLIEEALRTIEDSPVSLAENVLAQKIKLKTYALCRYENGVNETLTHMRMRDILDRKSEAYGEILMAEGISSLGYFIANELGIDPNLTWNVTRVREEPHSDMSVGHSLSRGNEPLKQMISDLDSFSEITSHEVEGFSVIDIEEIFYPNKSNEFSGMSDNEPFSLDSATLADIYAKQGHVAKAIGVYKRLLKVSPSNDLYRKRIDELSKLRNPDDLEEYQPESAENESKEAKKTSLKDDGSGQEVDFYNNLLNRIS